MVLFPTISIILLVLALLNIPVEYGQLFHTSLPTENTLPGVIKLHWFGQLFNDLRTFHCDSIKGGIIQFILERSLSLQFTIAQRIQRYWKCKNSEKEYCQLGKEKDDPCLNNIHMPLVCFWGMRDDPRWSDESSTSKLFFSFIFLNCHCDRSRAVLHSMPCQGWFISSSQTPANL